MRSSLGRPHRHQVDCLICRWPQRLFQQWYPGLDQHNSLENYRHCDESTLLLNTTSFLVFQMIHIAPAQTKSITFLVFPRQSPTNSVKNSAWLKGDLGQLKISLRKDQGKQQCCTEIGCDQMFPVYHKKQILLDLSTSFSSIEHLIGFYHVRPSIRTF